MARVATATALILALVLSGAALGEVVRVTADQTQLYDAQTKQAQPVSIKGKRFMVYGFSKDWYLVRMTISNQTVFRWIPKADVEVDWGDARVGPATVVAVQDVNTFETSNGTRLQFRRVQVPTNDAALAKKTLAWLKGLLEGKQVTLEFDTTARNARGYREAYVYVDGVCVNRLLVEHGLAEVPGAAEKGRYDAVLVYHARRAAAAKRGIWAPGSTARSPEAPATEDDQPSGSRQVRSNPPEPRRLTPAQLTQWSLQLKVEVRIVTERIDLGDAGDGSCMRVPATGINDGIVVPKPRPPEFDGIVPVG